MIEMQKSRSFFGVNLDTTDPKELAKDIGQY